MPSSLGERGRSVGNIGTEEGTSTGTSTGTSVGTSAGTSVGTSAGTSVGTSVGTSTGTSLGGMAGTLAGAFGTHTPCLFFRVPRGHRFVLTTEGMGKEIGSGCTFDKVPVMTFAVMAEASANTWTNGCGSIIEGSIGASVFAFGTHTPCLFFRVPRGHRFGLGASDDIYVYYVYPTVRHYMTILSVHTIYPKTTTGSKYKQYFSDYNIHLFYVILEIYIESSHSDTGTITYTFVLCNSRDLHRIIT
jgi:hypothetical protein